MLFRSAPGRHDTDPVPQGIDRLVWNVEHGRFERALSGLTAGAALVTGLEIFLEHDRASFANKVMWWPVALTPVALAAGVAGVTSSRMAKTFLPLPAPRLGGRGRQRPPGDLAARARHRPEAGRLEDAPLQPGNGPAAVRPRRPRPLPGL
jgi:hypothetical protein